MIQTNEGPGRSRQSAEADLEAGQLHGTDDSTGRTTRKALSRQQRWRQRNPLAYAAHLHVATLLRLGLLIPKPCEVCGAEKVHAHHPDANKPNEVRFLCPAHHKQEHREMRRSAHDRSA